VRIGLTRNQVDDLDNPRLREGIEVKPGDSRADSYREEYGDRCWETDILPAVVDIGYKALVDRPLSSSERVGIKT
jgi:hypothetical protein